MRIIMDDQWGRLDSDGFQRGARGKELAIEKK
jgi:hypothetical protein